LLFSPYQKKDILSYKAYSFRKQKYTKSFLLLNEVPRNPRSIIMSGKFGKVPERVRIGGVAASPHGKLFSTYDFFGEQISMNYLVLDMERFKRYISAYLELKFRARNPNPDRAIRQAFTQYMHDHNLHWSECQQ
jgi:hypothetical protein